MLWSTRYSAFNTIRLETLQVRGMVIAGLATTPVTPVKPWIGWQNFGERKEKDIEMIVRRWSLAYLVSPSVRWVPFSGQ